MKIRLALSVFLLTVATISSAAAAGSAIVLVPGAGGATPNDFLVRNRETFARYGLEVLIATSAREVASASSQLRARGQKVTLVGMSAGTPTVAEAIASGASPNRVVLVSGTLMPGRAQRSVSETLRTPGLLPPTLVVHNRSDQCPMTPPEAVTEFIRWSGGRARVSWVGGGGGPGGPCGPLSAHGFYGNDAQAVAAIAAYAK